MNWAQLGSLLWTGTVDTLYMTFWSSLIAYLIGLPLMRYLPEKKFFRDLIEKFKD